MFNNFDGWGMQYSEGELAFWDYLAFKRMKERNIPYYEMGTTRYRSNAIFGTATYSYNGIYTITGTARYEGTNRLGKSRAARWLPTWNIAGAWNAHGENFFEYLTPTLSHFTLKASYSLTADVGPAFVTNADAIIRSKTPWRPTANASETAFYIEQLKNEDLTYEKKHEPQCGGRLGAIGQ